MFLIYARRRVKKLITNGSGHLTRSCVPDILQSNLHYAPHDRIVQAAFAYEKVLNYWPFFLAWKEYYYEFYMLSKQMSRTCNNSRAKM